MLLLGTVYSFSVFRVVLEETLGIGPSASGLPYMVSLASYALAMFLAGRRLDRYPPAFWITTGGLLISAGWILSSFTNSLFWLTIFYGLISGTGVGVAYGVPMRVVSLWFPEKRGLAVGVVLLGFGLSPLLTAPVAELLIERFGVMPAFRIMGLCFGIALPLLALLQKNPPGKVCSTGNMASDSPETLESAGRRLLRDRRFWFIYLNFFIATMIGLLLIGLTAGIGSDYIMLATYQVVWLISLFAIMNGLGRPLFGWLTDHMLAKWVMRLSYILILIAAVMMILARPGQVLLYGVSMSIFWMNLGGWLAIAPTATLRVFGEIHYSRNYGLIFTAYGGGALAGVSTSGLLLDLFDNYRVLFIFIIVLAVMGLLLVWRLSSPPMRNTLSENQ